MLSSSLSLSSLPPSLPLSLSLSSLPPPSLFLPEFICGMNSFSTSCRQQGEQHHQCLLNPFLWVPLSLVRHHSFIIPRSSSLVYHHSFIIPRSSATAQCAQVTGCWMFLSPQYESKKRISGEEAMKHSHFRQLGMKIHALPESECLSVPSFCTSCLLPCRLKPPPLCCRCLNIHIKGGAAAEGPWLQEPLVHRVRWVGNHVLQHSTVLHHRQPFLT